MTDIQHHQAKLVQAGFTQELKEGETVLPAIIGPASRFNAEGKQIIRRDLPKETMFRQVEWHWTEHHGNDTVERSGIRDVPYERYPRDLVPPPSVELSLVTNANQRFAATPAIEYSDQNEATVLSAVNLCLEYFGECEIFQEDLSPTFKVPILHLNWDILPVGKYPWKQMQKMVQPIIDQAKKGNQAIISHRLELLNDAQPEFVAVGHGGFNSYIIFAFPAKNLYVLESTLYANATYVFEQNWEQLSRMTKAEILNQTLQKVRIVHRMGWDNAIMGLFV